jgi:hypothetical protein
MQGSKVFIDRDGDGEFSGIGEQLGNIHDCRDVVIADRDEQVRPNAIILHSGADEVVPYSDSVELLQNSGLPGAALIAVSTEHRLADEGSLGKMAEVVERVVAERTRTTTAKEHFRGRA